MELVKLPGMRGEKANWKGHIINPAHPPKRNRKENKKESSKGHVMPCPYTPP
jgi:hypothetical protein